MKNFKDDVLEIVIESQDNKILMKWIGKSDNREPSKTLLPFFTSLIENINGKELQIEFRSLEYMNSSTVPPLVQLFSNLNKNGTQTRVLYNKSSKWQVVSFKALEKIAETLPNIEVEGI